MADTNVLVWWIVFSNLAILDVILWSAGALLGFGSDGSFRALASAALLLYVVLAMLVGWGIAAAVWLAGLWVYAIIVNVTQKAAPAEA